MYASRIILGFNSVLHTCTYLLTELEFRVWRFLFFVSKYIFSLSLLFFNMQCYYCSGSYSKLKRGVGILLQSNKHCWFSVCAQNYFLLKELIYCAVANCIHIKFLFGSGLHLLMTRIYLNYSILYKKKTRCYLSLQMWAIIIVFSIHHRSKEIFRKRLANWWKFTASSLRSS